MTTFQKVRFSQHATSNDPELCTAGLVLDAAKLANMTVSDISRLFPYSESHKMRVLQVSKKYPHFYDAFNHQFTELD